MNSEVQAQIAVWRAKSLEGTMTEAEYIQAIILLRGDRKGAAIASERSRKAKVKGPAPSAEDLLNELEGL